MLIEIPNAMSAYLEAASLRLGYLYPALAWEVVPGGVRVSGSDMDRDEVARQVRYTVYREKIFSETLGLRHALLTALNDK